MHALSCILILCVENCVAAIGAMRFSVRSFGCALFYFVGGSMYRDTIIKWSLIVDGLIFGVFAYIFRNFYNDYEVDGAPINTIICAVIAVILITVALACNTPGQLWSKSFIKSNIIDGIVGILGYIIVDEELLRRMGFHRGSEIEMCEIVLTGLLCLSISSLIFAFLYLLETAPDDGDGLSGFSNKKPPSQRWTEGGRPEQGPKINIDKSQSDDYKNPKYCDGCWICRTCGKKNLDSRKFCWSCGAKHVENNE